MLGDCSAGKHCMSTSGGWSTLGTLQDKTKRNKTLNQLNVQNDVLALLSKTSSHFSVPLQAEKKTNFVPHLLKK